MNIGQIRNYVRTQLDVDEEEYPNDLIDAYIDEGFNRMVSLEPRWPGYESVWTLIKLAGESTIAVPSDLNVAAIDSIINQETGQRLLEIGPEMAEDYLLVRPIPSLGVSWFTTYGNTITLWPQVNTDDEATFTIRAQRIPTPVDVAESSVPDMDARLHRPLCNFVIALMYANQEDEVLEDTYMKRWQAGFAAAHRSIFSGRISRPVVLNGGLRTQLYYTAGAPVVAWDL